MEDADTLHAMDLVNYRKAPVQLQRKIEEEGVLLYAKEV